jgi:hypothetical protein
MQWQNGSGPSIAWIGRVSIFPGSGDLLSAARCQEAPFPTFDGTLISDMSFGTFGLQVVDYGPIVASGSIKRMLSETRTADGCPI